MVCRDFVHIEISSTAGSAETAKTIFCWHSTSPGTAGARDVVDTEELDGPGAVQENTEGCERTCEQNQEANRDSSRASPHRGIRGPHVEHEGRGCTGLHPDSRGQDSANLNVQQQTAISLRHRSADECGPAIQTRARRSARSSSQGGQRRLAKRPRLRSAEAAGRAATPQGISDVHGSGECDCQVFTPVALANVARPDVEVLGSDDRSLGEYDISRRAFDQCEAVAGRTGPQESSGAPFTPAVPHQGGLLLNSALGIIHTDGSTPPPPTAVTSSSEELRIVLVKMCGTVFRADHAGVWMPMTDGPRADRRRIESMRHQLTTLNQTNDELRSENRTLRRRIEGMEAECSRRLDEAEHLRMQRARESRGAASRAYKAEANVDMLTEELTGMRERLHAANLRLAQAESSAKAAARKLLSWERTHTKEAEIEASAAKQLIEVSRAYAALQEMSVASEEAKRAEAERAEQMRKEQMSEWKERLGVDARYNKLPDADFHGGSSAQAYSSWRHSVSKHVRTVMHGRFESAHGVRAVAAGLLKAGDDVARKLLDTPEFASAQKAVVESVMARVAEHWTARLAVHIWDRLELSDAKMETLRHLLSFVYDPATNEYQPIKVWVNPNDENDYLVMAKLASRQKRKSDFNALADECNIVVGPDGHCQRDAVALVEQMYSRYSKAMRTNYSASRPAQPIFYLDATGSSLGRGITHVEAGSADFAGGAKQSRSTLAPLALYEGSDKAVPLREHLGLVLPSWNKLINSASLTVDGGCIPALPLTCADMQGTKALYGKTSASNPVWCKCNKGVDQQHKFPSEPVSSYDAMIHYCDSIGCELLTFEEMCTAAHYSPAIVRGNRFARFTCQCCGYSPRSEQEWRAHLTEFQQLSDEEQKARVDVHLENGVQEHRWRRHHFQLLFQPPAVHNGMESASVDMLHLIYLNVFKMLFSYTIHQNLPDAKKKLVRNYLKAASFYSYDAAADNSENPVMRWIGREVKKFIADAPIHLPFLLRLVAAPNLDADMAEMANEDGEMDLQEDDELHLGEPSAEDIAAEAEAEPAMMRAADVWDNFLALELEARREWATPEADTDEYRKQRAVAFFNAAIKTARDLRALNPELSGWVLHVLCFIAPRQYLTMGDPSRRSCDACESLGACCKKLIRHLTCRRRASSQQHVHNKSGRRLWTQTFTRGYIEQAFRRVSVHANLLHGEENQRYLQRVDMQLLETGKSGKKQCIVRDAMGVREAMSCEFVWSKEAALAIWS